MDVTYKITLSSPRLEKSANLTAGVVVNVHRTCEMGDAQQDFPITTLGGVASIVSAVATWIANDTATLTAKKAIRDANAAIQTAFELAIGPLSFTITI